MGSARLRGGSTLGLGVLGLLVASMAAAGEVHDRFLRVPPLRERSEAQIDSVLRAVAEEYPLLEERLHVLSLLTLGTPYQDGCLGEGRPPDSDPPFRLDRTDCTVEVLVLASLLHARSLEEARRSIVIANYREVAGRRPVTFENRLHFSVDRLGSSPYFEDVTSEVAPPESLLAVELVLNRRREGEELLPISWQRPVRVHYLPSRSVDEAFLDRLPRGLGVILVREANFALGVVAGHEGLLFGREFIHASKELGKVVRVPNFVDYLFPRGRSSASRFAGVIFYRFH